MFIFRESKFLKSLVFVAQFKNNMQLFQDNLPAYLIWTVNDKALNLLLIVLL